MCNVKVFVCFIFRMFTTVYETTSNEYVRFDFSVTHCKFKTVNTSHNDDGQTLTGFMVFLYLSS